MVTPHKTKIHEQSPELRWVGSRPAELKAYVGQWVAILGEEVIASGPTAASVVADLPRDTNALPLLLEVWPDHVDPDVHFIG